jgi:hypothetical protein
MMSEIESKLLLEEVLISVTMDYIKERIPFSEWYGAVKNSEIDELRVLIAHLVGTVKGLTPK